jgi:hypothetical protein
MRRMLLGLAVVVPLSALESAPASAGGWHRGEGYLGPYSGRYYGPYYGAYWRRTFSGPTLYYRAHRHPHRAWGWARHRHGEWYHHPGRHR